MLTMSKFSLYSLFLDVAININNYRMKKVLTYIESKRLKVCLFKQVQPANL